MVVFYQTKVFSTIFTNHTTHNTQGYDDVNDVTKRQEYKVKLFPWEKPPELRESYVMKAQELQFRSAHPPPLPSPLPV